MKTPVAYEVIMNENIDEFNKMVLFYMSNGWVPQGGVTFITRGSYCNMLCQAIVRYED